MLHDDAFDAGWASHALDFVTGGLSQAEDFFWLSQDDCCRELEVGVQLFFGGGLDLRLEELNYRLSSWFGGSDLPLAAAVSSQGEVELSDELFVAATQVAFARLDANVHQLSLLGLLEPLFDVERLLVGFLKGRLLFFPFRKTYRLVGELDISAADVARGVIRRRHLDSAHERRQAVQEGRVGLLGLKRAVIFSELLKI